MICKWNMPTKVKTPYLHSLGQRQVAAPAPPDVVVWCRTFVHLYSVIQLNWGFGVAEMQTSVKNQDSRHVRANIRQKPQLSAISRSRVRADFVKIYYFPLLKN